MNPLRLDSIQSSICKEQAELFEMAAIQGLDCDRFVAFYMNSSTATGMDSEFDHSQWAGAGYLMEELEDAANGLPRSDEIYDPEAMYWMGYLYRYWHFYTGESSKEIYKRVDAATMALIYPGYHTRRDGRVRRAVRRRAIYQNVGRRHVPRPSREKVWTGIHTRKRSRQAVAIHGQ